MADALQHTSGGPRVLIVTGASRGIGRAIALQAAGAGHAVAVNYHASKHAADEVVEVIASQGGRAVAIAADMGTERDIVRLFQETEEYLGPVAALVNNAAITGGFARVAEIDAERVERMLSVNLLGTMIACREVVRRMSVTLGGGGGAIVNLSSIAARTGGTGEWVHYAASKGAINSFTVGLAREVADEGIRVNAVAPGLVLTDLHETNGQPDRPDRMAPMIPMRRAADPHEIAAAVIWLLSDAASYVTGAILEVGGGR